MAKMDCFFKVFSVLKLLEDKFNGITAEDILEFFEDKGCSYTLRSAQNDMALLEGIAKDYELDRFLEFKMEGRRKRIKLKKPPRLIEDFINRHRREYILKLLEKCLGEDHIKEETREILQRENNLSVFEILGFNISKYNVSQSLVNNISDAIVNNSFISFEYEKIRTNEKKDYERLIPLKILISEDGWYLLVYDFESNQFKTFLIDHIRLKGTERIIDSSIIKLKQDKLREIENSIKNAKSIWYIGNTENLKEVIAILTKSVSYKIIDMEKKGISYFSEQKIIERFDDGSIKIKFKVADDGAFQVDFKKQVYPWIPDIKILKPKKYVEIVKRDMESMLNGK